MEDAGHLNIRSNGKKNFQIIVILKKRVAGIAALYDIDRSYIYGDWLSQGLGRTVKRTIRKGFPGAKRQKDFLEKPFVINVSARLQ